MPVKEAKVSVIMPLYNVEPYLEKSVSSITQQTYKNLEIILCDDGSTDNTLELAKKLAKKDKRIIVLKNDKNLKAGATRNKCIKASTGKYIAIQDADDYSKEDRIEKEVEILDNHPECSYVSTAMYRVNENGIWGEYHLWKTEPENKDFLWGLPYAHGTALFRREVLEEIQGYRIAKDTARTEDFDLFLRLHERGYRGYNIEEPLYYYYEDIEAFKRRKYRYRIDEAQMRFRAYRKLGLMPIGILFAIKPLIVGLIPTKLQYKLKQKGTKKCQQSDARVLEVVSTPCMGGIETMLMNVYRKIDRNKIQFDFTNHTPIKADYEDEIISLGGVVHHIQPIRDIGVLQYIKQMKNLVRQNHYDIVHSHISINNAFVLLGAKLGGAKIRISHAHTTKTEKPNTWKYNFAIYWMKLINKLCATTYCACGKLAGEFLYGKKLVANHKVIIINNALDIEKFKKCYGKQKEMRKKYNLPVNKKIIGHIGRFSGAVKNHQYILEIVDEIVNKNYITDCYFVLVGDGEDRIKYEQYVKDHHLSNYVLFFGLTNNIPEVMSCFDLFILPSLYEGFPVVLVESQASGVLACISNRITKEVDFGLNLIQFLGIDSKDKTAWINYIQTQKKPQIEYSTIEKTLRNKQFTVDTSIEKFYNIYHIEGVKEYD